MPRALKQKSSNKDPHLLPAPSGGPLLRAARHQGESGCACPVKKLKFEHHDGLFGLSPRKLKGVEWKLTGDKPLVPLTTIAIIFVGSSQGALYRIYR